MQAYIVYDLDRMTKHRAIALTKRGAIMMVTEPKQYGPVESKYRNRVYPVANVVGRRNRGWLVVRARS